VSQPDQFPDGVGTESLTDLSLAAEQADETKGGSSLLEGQLWGEGKTVTIHFLK